MRFKLWFWYEINTTGGLWKDSSRYCYQSSFIGDRLYFAGKYYSGPDGITYYTGLGWYGRTKAQWWNQYLPNPSTADGSWTLQVGHGPMDCKSGRAQRCQWR